MNGGSDDGSHFTYTEHFHAHTLYFIKFFVNRKSIFSQKINYISPNIKDTVKLNIYSESRDNNVSNDTPFVHIDAVFIGKLAFN